MKSKANNIEDYMHSLPVDRKIPMLELRRVILKNLPKGFVEEMNYGMPGFVVPHKLYPAGYHCDRDLPLPFMCIASQKNFIALYHMGMYSHPDLLRWFTTEYSKLNIGKPDMGKSCIRFKKIDNIPFKLIGELSSKISVSQWIETYENQLLNQGVSSKIKSSAHS